MFTSVYFSLTCVSPAALGLPMSRDKSDLFLLCFRPQARPLAHNSEVHLPALIWKTSRPRALLTASPGTAAPADLQSPCPSCASPCCSAEALLKTLFKEGSCCIWLHGQVENIRSYSNRASLLQCLAKPCNRFHSAVYLIAD